MIVVDDFRAASLTRGVCQPKVGESCHEWAWVLANVLRVHEPWDNMTEEDSSRNGQYCGRQGGVCDQISNDVYNHGEKEKGTDKFEEACEEFKYCSYS